jgi:hypothetical protein
MILRARTPARTLGGCAFYLSTGMPQESPDLELEVEEAVISLSRAGLPPRAGRQRLGSTAVDEVAGAEVAAWPCPQVRVVTRSSGGDRNEQRPATARAPNQPIWAGH